MLTLRLRLTPQAPNDTTDAPIHDEVVLADGRALAVPRANLAAAKALLAAQKAAMRRVAGTRTGSETSYVYGIDTIGLDSGVWLVEAHAEEPMPWMRHETMRAEKAS
jgi:hypothetical protein